MGGGPATRLWCGALGGRRRVQRPVLPRQEAGLRHLQVAGRLSVLRAVARQLHQRLRALHWQGRPGVPGHVERGRDPRLREVLLAGRPDVLRPVLRGPEARLWHLPVAGRPPLRGFLAPGQAARLWDHVFTHWRGHAPGRLGHGPPARRGRAEGHCGMSRACATQRALPRGREARAARPLRCNWRLSAPLPHFKRRTQLAAERRGRHRARARR
mmetsp:Transcript_56112/g.157433  ORF Transcript_56112/g.157433 Transcript_56112/m.157433 type:complete len:213 (+) Transcript_56112:619-1257(+)